MDNMLVPNMSVIQRFHCIHTIEQPRYIQWNLQLTAFPISDIEARLNTAQGKCSKVEHITIPFSNYNKSFLNSWFFPSFTYVPAKIAIVDPLLGIWGGSKSAVYIHYTYRCSKVFLTPTSRLLVGSSFKTHEIC